MLRLRPALLICSVLYCALISGCTEPSSASHKHAASRQQAIFAGDYPVEVVCTTAQVADILEHLGGSHVRVVNLMGPGVDPHLYKATPSDMRAFNTADIIFYNGLHLEGRMADMLVRYARRKPTFAVTENLEASNDPRLREPPEFEGNYDPHIWHDALLWSDCVRYAAEQLQAFDPKHADAYRAAADKYVAELSELHQEFIAVLSAVPKSHRVLVTAHDAFGYFGRAYDVEVHGLQGISTITEADIAGMEAAVELLVLRKIKAVFVESSVSPRNVQALIEGCTAKGHVVKIGGELFSDAMGEAGTTEATYVGMLRHNVETIARALE